MFLEKLNNFGEMLNDKISRIASVTQILLFGAVIACLTYTTPSYKQELQLPKFSFLTESERKVFIPLAERRKRCKASPECMVLAEAIVYEARGEGEIGRAAVAHVIMNRVHSNKWGNTIRDVVYQYKQFSYTLYQQASKPSQKDWDKGYLMAFEVINGMIESPVGDSTHYHTTSVNPKWAKNLKYVVSVDNHIFYE